MFYKYFQKARASSILYVQIFNTESNAYSENEPSPHKQIVMKYVETFS